MAYVTTNPPQKLLSNLDGSFNLWLYDSADVVTTVDGANYFTNGGSLGMKSGDVVIVVDRSAAIPVVGFCYVNTTAALTVDGTVDLTNVLAITATDSD